MKRNSLHRYRQGSIILVLLAALIFTVIFFLAYCFRQLQVNYRSLQGGAGQQVQKHEAPKDHQFLSPNQTLAFKDAPVFSWRRKTFKLVDHETERVLYESETEGYIKRCKWRSDGKACAVEFHPVSGTRDVVLLLIEGDKVTNCRPVTVIDPSRFIPEREQLSPLEWDHTVELCHFEDDGDLRIRWVGHGERIRHGTPVRVTRAKCELKVSYTASGDVAVVESFPEGAARSFDL